MSPFENVHVALDKAFKSASIQLHLVKGRSSPKGSPMLKLNYALNLLRFVILHCLGAMVLSTTKHNNHQLQRAATRQVKGFRGRIYEERLKALKLQPLENRRLRNDLALTLKILYNQIDLEATQSFKFSRRPGLRRSLIKPEETAEDETILHAALLIT